MKKQALLLLSVLFFTYTKAQDQLFLKDNTKLKVKVIEVGINDIKYKLQSNLTGPTYTEYKENVTMILYENGQHEIIVAPAANIAGTGMSRPGMMSRQDSMTYYGHANNISLNFLNFFNNEVGITYQREVFDSHFNIVIPVAFGVETPGITQGVYFSNGRRYSQNSSNYTLDKKLFEVGFGVNYYPSLTTNVNYFIGPVFKYMQYNGTQTYNYYVPASGGGSYGVYNSLTKSSILSRYTLSITNGFIVRTKSRLTLSLHASLGFKNDVVSSEIVDPITMKSINPLNSAMSLYFWSGFNVGFNF